MKKKLLYQEPQVQLFSVKLESTILSNGVGSVESFGDPIIGGWDSEPSFFF